MTSTVTCRLCQAQVNRTLIDLGAMPSANAYLRPDQLELDETRYPLHALVCDRCHLVQLEAMLTPRDLFGDYAYFSSYSDSWVEHARRYATSAIAELNLGSESLVIEVASNDGYLLTHFLEAGIPVLGIEPAVNVAQSALARGVRTETTFFGRHAAENLVQRNRQADLLIANNVLAHVPDLDDFVAGLALALKPRGVLSIEVPHLLRLIADTQFDTIYHEHFSYFSLHTVERALARHGLAVFDAEELQTHGGSLRISATHAGAGRSSSMPVDVILEHEIRSGLRNEATFAAFRGRVDRCRRDILGFLSTARADGKTVVAYGAAAKGNTLLNFCGVTTDDIEYVADRSTAKQGKYLPGSHLAIEPPDKIFETRPDFVVVLPWNIQDEIRSQLAGIRQWGGQFVIFTPSVDVLI